MSSFSVGTTFTFESCPTHLASEVVDFLDLATQGSVPDNPLYSGFDTAGLSTFSLMSILIFWNVEGQMLRRIQSVATNSVPVFTELSPVPSNEVNPIISVAALWREGGLVPSTTYNPHRESLEGVLHQRLVLFQGTLGRPSGARSEGLAHRLLYRR